MFSPVERFGYRQTVDVDADEQYIDSEPVGYGSLPAEVHRVRQGSLPVQSQASRGVAAMFGLDARAAVLVILVDLMVFGADVISVGALLPLSIAVSGVLGVIVYKIQTHWFGDDKTSALIKSLIVALLTAIPVPLSPLMALPGGLIGVVKAMKRR